MDIYNNKSSQICPDLPPKTPQGSQTYYLNKLTKIEAYLRNEIEVCKRWIKKMRSFNIITSVLGRGMI